MYIYIHMFIHILSLSIYRYMYISISLSLYLSLSIYIYTYTYTHICTPYWNICVLYAGISLRVCTTTAQSTHVRSNYPTYALDVSRMVRSAASSFTMTSSPHLKSRITVCRAAMPEANAKDWREAKEAATVAQHYCSYYYYY